jgi:hypothetical protein
MYDRVATADRDSVTTPWSHMPHHRVATVGRDPLTKKVRRLLTLRRSNNGHQLWGNASAKDWARAVLGGTNEPAALSSVFGSALRPSKKARVPRTAGLMPVLLRKMIRR